MHNRLINLNREQRIKNKEKPPRKETALLLNKLTLRITNWFL